MPGRRTTGNLARLTAETAQERRRKEMIDSLRQIPLFAQLEEFDFEDICASLIERRYPTGTVVMEEGVLGDFMYVIWEGRVKVTKASKDGRERILDLREEGDFFGEMALIDDGPRFASVITLQPTCLLALSRTTFLDLLSRSSGLSRAVMHALSERLRWADEQASSMCFDGAADRTWSLLQRLVRRPRADGKNFETPPLTHQQIADMIGTSRETVTRAISQLKRVRSLEQVGKRYRIHPH